MIYVITHKEFNEQASFGGDAFYTVLHVGTGKPEKRYLRDDTGNQISAKNRNYCELTGYYWLWKNAKEKSDEILGVVHYRRGFSSFGNGARSILFGSDYIPLKRAECEKILADHDFIVPVRHVFWKDTVYEQYAKAHDAADVDAIRNILADRYPEYLDSFDRVFREHVLYTGNLFITRRELFDRYCAWLFDLLFAFEENNDMEKYQSAYNKRVYGFLAERLLNVFLLHHSFRVKELPAVNIEKYCKNH